MRRRAAKQTLQHETRHWQERLACWIKDKDKAETGNSLAAWVNLGWFHSREIPGVCIQRKSLQPGNPPQLGPAPPLHSQCCKPVAEHHDGQHTPLALAKIHAKDAFQRTCKEVVWFVLQRAWSSRKNSRTHEGPPENEPMGHCCSAPGCCAWPAMPHSVHGGSFCTFLPSRHNFCNTPLQQTHLSCSLQGWFLSSCFSVSH